MDTSNRSQAKGKRTGPADKTDALGREAYWIALTAKEDAKPFGSSRGGETVLNNRGKALAACWRELSGIRPAVETDALVITPRGLQGLFIFSPRKKEPVTLVEAVKLFKVLSSLRLAQLGKTVEAAGARPKAGARAAASSKPAAGPRGSSALWKKGFTEKSIAGSAGLAEARRALKALQAR